MSKVRALIPAAAILFPSACSNGAARHDAGNEALVVPADLTVTALAGGNGVLDVIALTLHEGHDGTELYAALKNDGDVPACDAALSVELFDQSQRSLAAGIGALFTRHFYRLSDGSGAVAACAGPGDVAMAALTDLPSDAPIEDVGYVVYRCPYFALDVVPIRGLIVGPVTRVARDGTTAYAGTLFNELDVAVSRPSVTVFPTNHVGRPLGATTGTTTISIPPSGNWSFETNAAETDAADYAAYPAGSFAN